MENRILISFAYLIVLRPGILVWPYLQTTTGGSGEGSLKMKNSRSQRRNDSNLLCQSFEMPGPTSATTIPTSSCGKRRSTNSGSEFWMQEQQANRKKRYSNPNSRAHLPEGLNVPDAVCLPGLRMGRGALHTIREKDYPV